MESLPSPTGQERFRNFVFNNNISKRTSICFVAWIRPPVVYSGRKVLNCDGGSTAADAMSNLER